MLILFSHTIEGLYNNFSCNFLILIFLADWFHCSECGKEFKLFKSLKKHIQTKHVENSASVIEIVEECVEHEQQEDNSSFQFLDIVEKEEIVEDEECDNFPFLVIGDECVISS